MVYYRNRYLFFLPVLLLLSFFLSDCKKKKEPVPPTETGTLTDVQGNVYVTVKIGSQWWMAENLRVKVYNDSSSITEIIPDSTKMWADTKSGAFCNIDRRYGLYYNWFALNNKKKLAPSGWHIPSDEEWKTLEMELGMSQEEADKSSWRGTGEAAKLIPNGSEGWSGQASAPVYGTNESGFSAFPGGCRVFNGTVAPDPTSAFFWTASGHDTSTAWYRNLSISRNNIFRYFTYKNYGFNVRCVKD